MGKSEGKPDFESLDLDNLVIPDLEHVKNEIITGINSRMFDIEELDSDIVEVPADADHLDAIFMATFHTLEAHSLLDIKGNMTPAEVMEYVEAVIRLLGEKGHIVGYRPQQQEE